MDFFLKLSKYWYVLLIALFFDILGLIPIIAPVFNFAFGAILFFIFGRKKIVSTGTIIGIGSILDFILGILPVNLVAAFWRIATAEVS